MYSSLHACNDKYKGQLHRFYPVTKNIPDLQLQETNQSICFHQHTGHAGWEWNVTGSSLKLCMGVQLHQSLGKHSLVFPRATHTYMYRMMYKNQNQGFVIFYIENYTQRGN